MCGVIYHAVPWRPTQGETQKNYGKKKCVMKL